MDWTPANRTLPLSSSFPTTLLTSSRFHRTVLGMQSSFGEESWENPKPGQSQLIPMPSMTNTYKSRP
jgi:hypothetical protein